MKVLILLLTLSLSAAAQSVAPCDLTVPHSPTLRGFRLDMAVEEVKGLTDMWGLSLNKAPDETGFVEALFIAPQIINPADRQNLASVRLGLLDGRVVTIEIRYDDSVKWRSAEEFTSAVSQSLKLPNGWQQQQVDILGLRCGEVGFAVTYRELGSVLTMHRTDTKAIRDKRRSEFQERSRRTFKP